MLGLASVLWWSREGSGGDCVRINFSFIGSKCLTILLPVQVVRTNSQVQDNRAEMLTTLRDASVPVMIVQGGKDTVVPPKIHACGQKA
jgi:hypothetical protein